LAEISRRVAPSSADSSEEWPAGPAGKLRAAKLDLHAAKIDLEGKLDLRAAKLDLEDLRAAKLDLEDLRCLGHRASAGLAAAHRRGLAATRIHWPRHAPPLASPRAPAGRMRLRREAMQFCIASLLEGRLPSANGSSVGTAPSRAQWRLVRQKCKWLVC